MNTLIWLLYLGAVTHFGVLIASALAPRALNWQHHLGDLPRLLRQMFWVYGLFIVLMIVGFGTLTVLHAPAMAAGDPVARSLCGFIAVFWGARLAVQLVVFDAEPFLTCPLYRYGYRALTLVFVYLTSVYGFVACAG